MSDDIFQSAVNHHRAGKLAEAEPLYRQVLFQSPQRHDVNYLLALLVFQLRNSPEAIDLIRAAIAANPNQAEYHANLGVMLASNQQFEEALAAYSKALAINPRSGETHNNVGNALLHLGRIREAADACRRAVECMPDSVLARYNLGNALVQLDQPDEAIAEYRRAIAKDPRFPQLFNNLGTALNRLGRWKEAAEACREAIKLQPNYAEAHNNLAAALIGLCELQQALVECRRTVQLQPKYAEAYANLGNVLKDLGRYDEAIAAYQQAIALRPDFASFYTNLGAALVQAGKPDDAMIPLQRALVLNPNLSGAHNNLAGLLKEMGRIPEAIDEYRRSLEIDPSSRSTRDNLILAAHYDPHYNAASLRREAEEWAAIHAQPLYAKIKPHANNRDPDRPLRIGYLSPDFRDHVLGHAFLPILRGHHHDRFKIYCYSNSRKTDNITVACQSHAGVWRDIRAITDDQAAQEIRDDQIDILVDLALYTAGNRLPIFAQKPAPIQATYLAYAGTSGLKMMDYRLSDPYFDTTDADLAAYTEKTIRLPHIWWHYEPSQKVPDVSPPPSAQAGFITFGCLNNVAKMSQPALTTWAEILSRVENSRMILHSTSNDHQHTVISMFSRRGIQADRIEFIPKTNRPDYLNNLTRIDIALDPFPYAGGVTTCDNLWMGVPVVTLSGSTAVGRGGRSILYNIGLAELVAETREQYIQLATDLATNPARLADLRTNLRSRMQSSPLMNLQQFVTDLETAYRQMWRTWCSGAQ